MGFRSNIFIVAAFAVLICGPVSVFSQKRPAGNSAAPPAPPPRKPSPEEEEKLYQARRTAILAEDEAWKEYIFPDDGFKALFPRTPLESSEIIADPGFGRMTVKTFMGIGDRTVLAVGRMIMPYAVRDESVAKEARDGGAEGLFDPAEFTIEERRETVRNGVTILQICAKRKDNGSETLYRTFLVGKSLYYGMAMTRLPLSPTPEFVSARDAAVRSDKEKFLDSIAVHEITEKKAVIVENPLFKSTFADGIFRSDYFKFTLKPPENWHEVPYEDQAGVRRQAKDLVELNSDINMARTSSARRNMFTFAMKPLGAGQNYQFSMIATKSPLPGATTRQIAMQMERTMAGIQIYEISKKTYPVTLGKNTFYAFDMNGVIGGFAFKQTVYLTLRKGYVLFFSATYNDETRPVLLEAMKTLTFETP